MAIERIKELEKQVKAGGAEKPENVDGDDAEDSAEEECPKDSKQNGEDDIVTPDGQKVSCFCL